MRVPERPSRSDGPKAEANGFLVRRFRMASRRAAVAPMVERVLGATAPARLDLDQRHDLAVAVTEALANAALHGNRLHPNKNVRVTVEVEPDRSATVRVKDSGAGFDTRQVADPTDEEHLMRSGGRGVFLMKRLVDEFEYNTAGNEVVLTKRRRRSSGAGRSSLR